MTGRNMVFSNRSNPGSERLTTGPALKGQHTWGLTCHQIISYQCKTHYFLSICKKICSYSINIYIYMRWESYTTNKPWKTKIPYVYPQFSITYLPGYLLPPPTRKKQDFFQEKLQDDICKASSCSQWALQDGFINGSPMDPCILSCHWHL